MAHKKAGSSKATQGGNVKGKHLGVKTFGEAVVQPGTIIVRQRGKHFLPGKNVGLGKDFTIFSKIHGIVKFVNTNDKRKRIDVEKMLA
ncbi:MAG: 50S ribosomal protein L27 [Patescibacteria group bacterium]|uniref:Large ribosomal subunit protein bL27 n=1 Tax=candidate division WWE3 bacterium TaxID=2053526 RepID=A0A955ECL0_UNCKA|nr:50S ribosomal protein L27 [candidate division WWE3 bacterium]